MDVVEYCQQVVEDDLNMYDFPREVMVLVVDLHLLRNHIGSMLAVETWGAERLN